MDDVSIWTSLGAGIASFISPCVLPMVPVYLATLAGPQIFDDDEEEVRRFHLPLFLHALCFVLGFTVIFTLLGAISGLAGITINSYSPLARWISGGILVVFGLVMLASQYVPFFGREMRITPKLGQTTGYLRSFFVGAAFTVAWTPCVSPFLGTVLTMSMASETAWHGAFLLIIYSLGFGIPFLLIGAFFGVLSPAIRRLERASRVIYHISAAILIAIGILIIIGKISLLNIA